MDDLKKSKYLKKAALIAIVPAFMGAYSAVQMGVLEYKLDNSEVLKRKNTIDDRIGELSYVINNLGISDAVQGTFLTKYDSAIKEINKLEKEEAELIKQKDVSVALKIKKYYSYSKGINTMCSFGLFIFAMFSYIRGSELETKYKNNLKNIANNEI
ncbi:MAG: hypothetical protein WC758_02485 [Candidatus Woesearchaeota archaeon]